CRVDGAEQAPASEPSPSPIRVDLHLAESGKFDHQAVVASAEAGQAMPAATNGGHDVGFDCHSQTGSNVIDVFAASQYGGFAIVHSVPHRRCSVIVCISGPQQRSLAARPDLSVNLFHIAVHLPATQTWNRCEQSWRIQDSLSRAENCVPMSGLAKS